LKRVLVAIVLAIVGASATASEQRSLNDTEEADLKTFASEKGGIDTWYVHSSVTELKGEKEAYAMVVFEPASTTEYCLAPAATFVGSSAVGEPLVWETPENAKVSYRFWFESCDRASPESSITLKELLDFDVLEKIKGERDSIIDAMEKRLEMGRQEADPPSALQLSEIDLSYDTEHGPVYHIKYSLGYCFWLSADVIFESGKANVVEAWRVVC
jgi:hypothetical protein